MFDLVTMKIRHFWYVRNSEKASKNFSQNNSAISININIWCILEIIKKHATEEPYLNWNSQG